MQRLLRMTFLGLLLVMTGCIPTLHPLYTEADLIFDPSLVGEWTGKDGKETWTFTKSTEKEYKLLYVDEDGKKGEFDVNLLKVKDNQFLDFFPLEPSLKENDFYKAHLLPVHTFMRVQQIEPTLQLVMLKLDWLEKFLKENPGAIRHEKEGNRILITAQPKELQAFLIKHEKTADAWSESDPLTRRVEKQKE